jgi:hypothetical protein
MPHVDFMLHLSQQMAEEEQVQNRIHEIRARHPNNQFVQLKLDRQQEVVDQRREALRDIMRNIAKQN